MISFEFIPTKNFIKVVAFNHINSIILTNYLGQRIKIIENINSTKYTINTDDLNTGVYFIEVKTLAGSQKSKIIITK